MAWGKAALWSGCSRTRSRATESGGFLRFRFRGSCAKMNAQTAPRTQLILFLDRLAEVEFCTRGREEILRKECAYAG